MCWTANDCLSKKWAKQYKFEPGANLASEQFALLDKMSRFPRSVLVLAGNASTWTVGTNANAYNHFHESCRSVALYRGIACIDGTTWHGHCSSYRTKSGSHTRSSLESRNVWRWLLLATATFAAEQPRIRAFPVSSPVEPYPDAVLVLPNQAPTDQVEAPAAPMPAPRPLMPPAHEDDKRIVAQQFSLLWSPILGPARSLPNSSSVALSVSLRPPAACL